MYGSAGWVAGSIGSNANSASVEVEVEVEAELGNKLQTRPGSKVFSLERL